MVCCDNCQNVCCCHRFFVEKGTAATPKVDSSDDEKPAEEDTFVLMKPDASGDEQANENVAVIDSENAKVNTKKVSFSQPAGDPTKFIISIRAKFDLKLPKDFFETCEKSTTRFNILSLSDKEDNKVVVKWVKDSHECNFIDHFGCLIHAAQKTSEVLSAFVEKVYMFGWRVRVIKPLVLKGSKEMGIEPCLNDVEKFNSNTFWETDSAMLYRNLMKALAHYSFVFSEGDFVLTNLRGEVDMQEQVITLLPPSLVSGNAGGFGCQDLGVVKSFLEHHHCNSICQGLGTGSGTGTEKPVSDDGGDVSADSGPAFEVVEE